MPLGRAQRLEQQLLVAVVRRDERVVEADEQRRHVLSPHVLDGEGHRRVGPLRQVQQHDLPAGEAEDGVQQAAGQREDVQVESAGVHRPVERVEVVAGRGGQRLRRRGCRPPAPRRGTPAPRPAPRSAGGTGAAAAGRPGTPRRSVKSTSRTQVSKTGMRSSPSPTGSRAVPRRRRAGRAAPPRPRPPGPPRRGRPAGSAAGRPASPGSGPARGGRPRSAASPCPTIVEVRNSGSPPRPGAARPRGTRAPGRACRPSTARSVKNVSGDRGAVVVAHGQVVEVPVVLVAGPADAGVDGAEHRLEGAQGRHVERAPVAQQRVPLRRLRRRARSGRAPAATVTGWRAPPGAISGRPRSSRVKARRRSSTVDALVGQRRGQVLGQRRDHAGDVVLGVVRGEGQRGRRTAWPGRRGTPPC